MNANDTRNILAGLISSDKALTDEFGAAKDEALKGLSQVEKMTAAFGQRIKSGIGRNPEAHTAREIAETDIAVDAVVSNPDGNKTGNELRNQFENAMKQKLGTITEEQATPKASKI